MVKEAIQVWSVKINELQISKLNLFDLRQELKI